MAEQAEGCPAADANEIISAVRAAGLTYCGPPKLETLATAVAMVNGARVPGRFIEAGVALGGSAIVLAKLKGERRLDLYDVFGMIPPPSDRDGEDAHKRYAEIAAGRSPGLAGNKYYGYISDLQSKVEENLAAYGIDLVRDQVFLVPGLFEYTLWPEEPVALAHIDCDWYDSVTVCIKRIAPKLAAGAIVVFDDYSSYSGCRKAVDEWLSTDARLEIVANQRSIAIRKKA